MSHSIEFFALSPPHTEHVPPRGTGNVCSFHDFCQVSRNSSRRRAGGEEPPSIRGVGNKATVGLMTLVFVFKTWCSKKLFFKSKNKMWFMIGFTMAC